MPGGGLSDGGNIHVHDSGYGLLNTGRQKEAFSYVKEALARAMPDGI
jgi:hypothetical protein